MKFLIVTSLILLAGLSARATESPAAALDKVMSLRLEVESLNDTWEREKIRVKSEYEKSVERLAALKDETSKQKSSIDLAKARIAGFKNRENQSRQISGQDEVRLKKVISEFHADLKTMLPAGRKQSEQQLADLAKNLSEKSTEEAVEELTKVIRSELSFARGTHLFRENYDLNGKTVSLEMVRVGNVFAYVADTEGRFGIWRLGKSEPSFDLSSSELKLARYVFAQAREAKKIIAIEAIDGANIESTLNGDNP